MDMIVWHNIDRYSKYDLCFTHWESAHTSQWYTPRKVLRRPPNYRFKREWPWNIKLAMNASLLYFGNQELKDYYSEEALRYIRHNTTDIRFTNFATPEVIFVEQPLLLMCLKARGGVAAPFLNTMWSPKSGHFLRHDAQYGPWAFATLSSEQLISHAWIHKWHLRDHKEDRIEYCRMVADVLAAEFPDRVPEFERVEVFAQYYAMSSA